MTARTHLKHVDPAVVDAVLAIRERRDLLAEHAQLDPAVAAWLRWRRAGRRGGNTRAAFLAGWDAARNAGSDS